MAEPVRLWRGRGQVGPQGWLCLLIVLALTACGGLPKPPGPMPSPGPPPVDDDHGWPGPELVPPRAIAPALRWEPPEPAEGTLVALLVEPAPRGLPLFEVHARASGEELQLISLSGGTYLGLVGAPIGAREIPIEIDVTLIDGTQLTPTRSLVIAEREFDTTTLSVDRRFTAPDEETLERIKRERKHVRSVLRTITETPLWRGPFIQPRYDVTTSPFGQRRLFNSELRSRHTGLDIDGETGDPIYAANSGRVAIARGLFFNGISVFLDHGLGLYTGYFHMSQIDVAEGEWVEKGDVIGRVGATGRVTGPHLHWGLYHLGVPLDPLSSLLLPDFTRASELLSPPVSEPAR